MGLRLFTAIVGFISSITMMVGIIYYHLNAEFSDMLDMHISRYTIVIMYLFAAFFLICGILALLSFKNFCKNKQV